MSKDWYSTVSGCAELVELSVQGQRKRLQRRWGVSKATGSYGCCVYSQRRLKILFHIRKVLAEVSSINFGQE